MVEREREFIKTVKAYWRKHGRHDLPWRETDDPYYIHVSEVMLQQTQVERVIPKYRAFLKQWPTVAVLAKTPLGDVVRAWQGLGYNSRAKRLQESVHAIVTSYQGKYPQTCAELKQLPGIGPYTAGAIMAFAFNKPVPIIETNIRTVFLHHFFGDRDGVTDTEVLELVEQTLGRKQPREWYWALMDYGAYLKKEHGNPNYRSRSYVKQSKFVGSDRQIRGALIRAATKDAFTREKAHQLLGHFDARRVDTQIGRLLEESLLVQTGRTYRLPE